MIPSGLHLSAGRLWLLPRVSGTVSGSPGKSGTLRSCAPLRKGPSQSSRRSQRVKSHSSDMASNESDFDLTNYRLAEILHVSQSSISGPPQWMIVLKIQESDRVVTVYVGDTEGSSLQAGIQAAEQADSAKQRPRSYDMMKNSLSAVGARVTKVCITALVNNTYMAKAYLLPEGTKQERAVDSRPSDALNMAVRFGAPVYVNKVIVSTMGQSVDKVDRKLADRQAPPSEIEKSCKDALTRYHDPTVLCKVSLQVAIKEDRFEDAAKIRDQIEKLLSQDRTLSLAVAMQSALEDKRFEEAAYLRDMLMDQIEGSAAEKMQDIA